MGVKWHLSQCCGWSTYHQPLLLSAYLTATQRLRLLPPPSPARAWYHYICFDTDTAFNILASIVIANCNFFVVFASFAHVCRLLFLVESDLAQLIFLHSNGWMAIWEMLYLHCSTCWPVNPQSSHEYLGEYLVYLYTEETHNVTWSK